MMAGKSISSVLEKIRKRKMEVLKKVMVPGKIQHNDSVMEIALEVDPKEGDFIIEKSESSSKKAAWVKPVAECSSTDAYPNASPVTRANEDEPHLTRISTQTHLEEKTAPSFCAPLNDTQDLFSDSQMSETQFDQSNEFGSLAEENPASSLPSLNLKFDSALPDDMCSDKEDRDEDNIEAHQKSLFKVNSSPKGDPVKEFVDEEALEDDSDNDLLHFEDEDEGDNADLEEVCDYIATDYKEKPIDRERRNGLHQIWLQQQDEAGTENLLQKLKCGTNQREPSMFGDEDDDKQEIESDDSDDEDMRDLIPMTGARVSTKKLKQLIPQMFTDKDDGFVSSEDEETEKKLTKQRLLQKLELEQQSKLLSPEKDKTSREILGRIKKLNTFPESKKRAKASSVFESLLTKGGSSISSKSSFLRRSSSQPVASTNRTGLSTGRSFIFGRDVSNTRSSIPLSEDSSDLTQSRKESNAKKNGSAKYISSQAKRRTSQTEIRTEESSSFSLFEILRCSSMQKGRDNENKMINHEAVFAAFKSVKKRVKVEGRS